MQIRLILLAGTVLGAAWLFGGGVDNTARTARTSTTGSGATPDPALAREKDAAPLTARQVLASPDSLFGRSASPFGRMDCNPNHPTTACNPDEFKDDAQVKAPVMTLIRDLSDEIRRGKFDAAGDLTANLRECSARMASAQLQAGMPAVPADPDENLRREEWACDPADVARLANGARSRLEQAAQGSNAPAKVAYGEFLKSDLLEAIAAMYREREKGADLTSPKARVAASKATVMTYAKSGMLAPEEAKQLLSSVEPLEADP